MSDSQEPRLDSSTPSEADVVRRALERAHADLPPEGVTIEAADDATMREELFGVLLDDAEHPERAA
ncbi:hypothetical protein [Nocardiopsis nanhaiensis]